MRDSAVGVILELNFIVTHCKAVYYCFVCDVMKELN